MIFRVPTVFKFEGDILVEADSAQEAEEAVDSNCGLVMGGSIHTTLDMDWHFPLHPEKYVGAPVALDESLLVKSSYRNGECPDCFAGIPMDAVDGSECLNCGHVFVKDVYSN